MHDESMLLRHAMTRGRGDRQPLRPVTTGEGRGAFEVRNTEHSCRLPVICGQPLATKLHLNLEHSLGTVTKGPAHLSAWRFLMKAPSVEFKRGLGLSVRDFGNTSISSVQLVSETDQWFNVTYRLSDLVTWLSLVRWVGGFLIFFHLHFSFHILLSFFLNNDNNNNNFCGI